MPLVLVCEKQKNVFARMRCFTPEGNSCWEAHHSPTFTCHKKNREPMCPSVWWVRQQGRARFSQGVNYGVQLKTGFLHSGVRSICLKGLISLFLLCFNNEAVTVQFELPCFCLFWATSTTVHQFAKKKRERGLCA